ncbi:MAG: 50S ribosomal protein L22 [Candidatus Curtissbacteria bacterium]
MQVTASVKNIRVSPEKVKLLVDQIIKAQPTNAVQILSLVNKSSSPVLKKVIASAIANAKNNHGIKEEDLFFKEILVGKGPMFKRFQPVSRGRAHHILKRTSHIRVVLGTKEATPVLSAKSNQKPLKIASEKKPVKQKGGKNGTKS